MMAWKRFLLKRRLRSPDAAVRLAAVKAIPHRALLDDRILQMLVSAARDVDDDVSAAARKALVRECLRGASTVRELKSLFVGKPAEDQRYLAEFLQGVASKLVSELQSLTQTAANALRRREAAETLAEIGDARAVPFLMQMLQADGPDDHWHRWAAIEELGKLGPAARAALPALEVIARTVHPPHSTASLRASETAQHALAAIARIEQASLPERDQSSG
jgi:HEAT repeat protein